MVARKAVYTFSAILDLPSFIALPPDRRLVIETENWTLLHTELLRGRPWHSLFQHLSVSVGSESATLDPSKEGILLAVNVPKRIVPGIDVVESLVNPPRRHELFFAEAIRALHHNEVGLAVSNLVTTLEVACKEAWSRRTGRDADDAPGFNPAKYFATDREERKKGRRRNALRARQTFKTLHRAEYKLLEELYSARNERVHEGKDRFRGYVWKVDSFKSKATGEKPKALTALVCKDFLLATRAALAWLDSLKSR